MVQYLFLPVFTLVNYFVSLSDILNLQFQHKEFAWLFAVIPVLILLFLALLQWKKKIIRRIGDRNLVLALISDFSPKRFTSKFILLSIAFAIGVIAVMNPRKPGGSEDISRKGIDVAIALDVSKSMLATDLQPNRLERAKQFITRLVNQMPNDRIALILFAGKAYLQMPLTIDHGAAQMYISAASPDAVPQQGTVISDALNMSARVFNNTEKRFKTVVLISDGEDHDEGAIRTAGDLASKGVMINTIGIGSIQGSTLIDPETGEIKKDAAGITVISKLNEGELKQIAERTHGIYIHLQGGDEAVSELQKQLSQIDRKAFGDISLMNFKTYYMWLAAAMLVLLIIEIFISEKSGAVA